MAENKRPRHSRDLLERWLPEIDKHLALIAQDQGHLREEFKEIKDSVTGPDGCQRVNTADIAKLKGFNEGQQGSVRLRDRFTHKEKTVGASILAALGFVGALIALLIKYGIL